MTDIQRSGRVSETDHAAASEIGVVSLYSVNVQFDAGVCGPAVPPHRKVCPRIVCHEISEIGYIATSVPIGRLIPDPSVVSAATEARGPFPLAALIFTDPGVGRRYICTLRPSRYRETTRQGARPKVQV